MKLAIIGPVYPYRGGIAHYTTLLAGALEENFDVKIISFRRQYPNWLYPGQSDKDPSSNPLRIQAEFMLDPLNPITWRDTSDYISRLKPKAVLLQWWTTFWAPSYYYLSIQLRRRNLPLLFLVHNVLPHEARPWDAWLARLALKKGSAFVVQTEQQKTSLLSLLPNAPVDVQPHPVYSMFSQGKISKNEARRILTLCPDKPIILFFGMVRPYKGLHTLIDALALLNHKGLNALLVIAGEFWGDKTSYLEQIAQAGLSAQISIHDRYILNEEVGTFFSAADVFAAPYTGGTQSGAVKMATGFGLPLVVSESIVDATIQASQGENLYIVPPQSPAALAEALEAVLRKPSSENVGGYSSEGVDNSWKNLAGLIAAKIAEL